MKTLRLDVAVLEVTTIEMTPRAAAAEEAGEGVTVDRTCCTDCQWTK